MTMSITVTNTSNWTDEILEVYLPGGGMWSLAPGQSTGIAIAPRELKTLEVVARRDDEKSGPHMTDGKQVFPKVKVDWKSA